MSNKTPHAMMDEACRKAGHAIQQIGMGFAGSNGEDATSQNYAIAMLSLAELDLEQALRYVAQAKSRLCCAAKRERGTG